MTEHPAEADPAGESPAVDRWPAPTGGQVEVLLLGTVHLAHPDFADVHERGRQREFEDLVDRLATWEPDGVAVERSPDQRDRLADEFDEFHAGDRQYRRADGPRDDPSLDDISLVDTEIVQIGFRLADRRGHDRVHPVDYPMAMDAHLDEDLERETFEEMKERAASTLDVPIAETPRSAVLDRWERSTVPGFLAWFNREAQLVTNEASHSAVALAGMDEEYRGARLLAGWYERNLRIVENLWRAASRADLDRITLVVGQGHVHVLRHLLANAPPFCPVSPRPLLPD